MVEQHAIVVRDARKRYGQGAPILNGLNLTVAKGSIYGLLGASGCGKTTLLSCVVGVQRLDKGEVWVLGGRPGSKGSGIPGPRVGYMPQDISLVSEFSVMGALNYFGTINGLDERTIAERYKFLKDLLQLPPKSRLIKQMSGGQQRRVSFAAALIHKPELLILDEPTVGLDPVLRDNIWNFLVKITQEEGVTVVITTHYIEETKQANTIGLMRGGQLLAESSPNALLERFQTDSLEDAFLTLSQLQVANQDRAITDSSMIFQSEPGEINTTSVGVECNYNYVRDKYHERKRSLVGQKLKALLMKNFVQFVRQPGGFLFAMVLPLVQVLVFFYSIGGDPKELKILIVNEEAGNCDYGKYPGSVFYNKTEFTCDYVDLSCRFLKRINDEFAQKIYHSSLEEAQKSIRRDKAVGIMYFRRKFSQSLQIRLDNALAVKDRELMDGRIEVTLDTADRQVYIYMQKKLYEIFFEVYENIMKECKVSPKYADVPMRFENPIFGTKNPNFSTFVAPAFLLTLTFFLATSVCSSIIISDREEGVWNRSLVQGVTTPEILFTHLVTQLVIIVIQVAISLILAFLHFELECKGSFLIVISLMVLEGICGMSYGFLISVLCTSHTLANYISTGSFYPTILLCGSIWPIEGMPKLLRWFSCSLPTTVPGISLRTVLNKGYSMKEPDVYIGFLIVLAWITIFQSVCLFNLRSKIGQ